MVSTHLTAVSAWFAQTIKREHGSIWLAPRVRPGAYGVIRSATHTTKQLICPSRVHRFSTRFRVLLAALSVLFHAAIDVAKRTQRRNPFAQSKECQKKHWPAHKTTCQLQSQNRESLPAKGTEDRIAISSVRKWVTKHTLLLGYAAAHAMNPHDPANARLIKTHAALSGKKVEFVYIDAALRGVADPEYNLPAELCAAFADSEAVAGRHRHDLSIYIRAGKVVHFSPISVALGAALQNVARLGSLDDDWKGFLERSIDKTLGG
ncbi:hypothetical protein DFH08DRAFT_931786 [Mycena albidolilacea]|uniref:Uncharacterized protein n=1 Tax=Mycena albidolilacea TaxID=1033008 RepID=A0AAD7EZS8_9AGAR|nr:hypothetical protein DFH08DRAFT_931786 [Mycena albidolilacea]